MPRKAYSDHAPNGPAILHGKNVVCLCLHACQPSVKGALYHGVFVGAITDYYPLLFHVIVQSCTIATLFKHATVTYPYTTGLLCFYSIQDAASMSNSTQHSSIHLQMQ